MQLPNRTEEQNSWIHKAADNIRQHPSSYSQNVWWDFESDTGRYINEKNTSEQAEAVWLENLKNPDCGTTACLKGHLGLAMAQCGVANIWTRKDGFDLARVSKLSGITAAEATYLFNNAEAHEWPEPYCARWFTAKEKNDPEAMAKAAADLFDDFADGLFWWDKDTGDWVTIEEYCDELDRKKSRGDTEESNGESNADS